MKKFFNIIIFSIKENIKTKIFLALLIFSITLIIIGLLLTGLSGFEQPQRVLINTGITMIEIFCVALIILNSINIFLQDIETKSIYLTLSKPISRTEYVVGKYIGLLFLIILSILLMSCIHISIIMLSKFSITTKEYFITMLSIFLKAGILGAISLLATIAMTSQLAAAITSILLWIAGHFTLEFIFIVGKIKLQFIQIFLKAIYYIIPNFQYFNLKDFFDSPHFMSEFSILKGIIYWVAYNTLAVTTSCVLFRKKDL